MSGRGLPEASFVVPDFLQVPEGGGVSEYVDPDGPPVEHATSATLLADGRLAAFWFAGSWEGAHDVGLYSATYDGGTWSQARRITDAEETGRALGRFIQTVGNSIVFRHPSGDYWMIFVSVSVGGWSGSSLNLVRSADGINWGEPQRLATSPFLNFSTLVKGPALIRSDGLVAVPAYHEFIFGFPEMILIDASGAVVGKRRMAARCTIQPWAVPLSPDRVLALFRDHGCPGRALQTIEGSAGGLVWSDLRPTQFGSPDAPSAAIAVPGAILAVTSEVTDSRVLLRTIASFDEGANWVEGSLLGADWPGRSYRYPWLMQDAAGRVHLFVTETTPQLIRVRQEILGRETWPEAPSAP